MSKLVYGIGINNLKGKSKTKEYRLWMSMLKRCYSNNTSNKYPTYVDCTVSENFKSFSYFYDWCQKQIGFGIDGFEMDKDLLIKGNKEYHEFKCVFIPSKINNILTRANSIRGNLPIGVCFHSLSGKYRSQIRLDGKQVDIGYFNSPFDAFSAYKHKKESYLKDTAKNYKNKIDPRSYAALLKYRVDFFD